MVNRILILILGVLMIQSCKKETPVNVIYPTGNTFTLNNTQYVFDKDSAVGSYDSVYDWTTISVGGSTSNGYATFNLRFPFSRIGTFKFSEANATHIEASTGLGFAYKNYVFFNPPDGKDMVIIVTQYDGKRIKGNFYGDMEEEQDSGWNKTQRPASVSLGSFDVIRK